MLPVYETIAEIEAEIIELDRVDDVTANQVHTTYNHALRVASRLYLHLDNQLAQVGRDIIDLSFGMSEASAAAEENGVPRDVALRELNEHGAQLERIRQAHLRQLSAL